VKYFSTAIFRLLGFIERFTQIAIFRASEPQRHSGSPQADDAALLSQAVSSFHPVMNLQRTLIGALSDAFYHLSHH
jgi:hypothetical protein